MSTTIRVNEATRDRLSALAAATNRPMIAVLDDAVGALERQRFFEDLNRGYERLRADDDAWVAVVEERRVESGVLRDDAG